MLECNDVAPSHRTAPVQELTQHRCNGKSHAVLHLTGLSRAPLIVASVARQELSLDTHTGLLL